jgi:lipoprotein Spr
LKEKAIQLKYAAYLKTSPSEIKSIRLYTFIDEWMGVPFLMGGTTKDGIDCSAFVQRLFLDVYRIQLPRTVIEQLKSARIEPFGSLKYVAEGDIIFFHTADNKYVSHVGVYLCNNMFINASTTSGVTISRLNSPYWRDAFILAGRVKSSFAKNAIPVQPILAGPGD